jgi:transposase, IS5 family
MLRMRNVQPSLWESVLPEVCRRLPAELERIDAWLDDERFFAPFVPYVSARMGRPSVPMESYLRLMFLKHRYRLGYESLCAEVSDSISWRRFCRIRHRRQGEYQRCWCRKLIQVSGLALRLPA